MKLAFLICVTGLTLGGCASKPERSIRVMRLTQEEVAGEQRLFSTFGFWAVGEPLRKRLLASYTADGVLDRVKLRQLLPEAQIEPRPDHVAVTVPSGAFTSFLLRDGPMMSLEPKFDAVIRELSSASAGSPRNLTIVPIGAR